MADLHTAAGHDACDILTCDVKRELTGLAHGVGTLTEKLQHLERSGGVLQCEAREKVIDGLRKTLRELFGLVQSGDLVRGTSRDGEPGYALRAMKLVMALKHAQELVAPIAEEDATMREAGNAGQDAAETRAASGGAPLPPKDT